MYSSEKNKHTNRDKEEQTSHDLVNSYQRFQDYKFGTPNAHIKIFMKPNTYKVEEH